MMGLFGNKKKTEESAASHDVILEDGTRVKVNQVVDCIGDSCPRPQLMTKAAMNKAAAGDILEIKVDNPTSVESLPPMMPELHGTHLGTVRADRYWQVVLQKN